MSPRQRALGEVIDNVINPEHELLHADITLLSNMNADGLAMFKSAWAKAPHERRLQLISRMAGLSEEDFVLDFTGVFELGLNDEAEDVRIKAIEGIELEDKHAYARPLIKALRSDDSADVRAVAAKALGKFALMTECGDAPRALAESIFSALLENLEDPKEPMAVRRRALESIAPFHEELVEQYIEDYYQSEDAKVKASALLAMGVNCGSRWLQHIIDEMQSESAELRFEAARSSGEIGEEAAVPHLLTLLDDMDPEVQDAAILSLGKIGGEAAKRALQKLVKSGNARVKEAAGAALAELVSCEDPLSLSS